MRAILVLALLLLTTPTVAQEKFTGSNVDLRTLLAFKASDGAVQKMLPDGWEVNSITSGPAKGSNLVLVLVDQQTSYDADGKSVATFRAAVLGAPAKKKGTDTAGVMVFGGLSDDAGAPGAYSVYDPAQTTVERKTYPGGDKKLTTEESWQFKAANGNSIDVQLQFLRGAAAKGKVEAKVFSAAKPDFFRIYRVEEARDLVRSTAVGVDRLAKVSVKASGDKLKELFDGTEQLISVTSIPWYSRQVYLPSS